MSEVQMANTCIILADHPATSNRRQGSRINASPGANFVEFQMRNAPPRRKMSLNRRSPRPIFSFFFFFFSSPKEHLTSFTFTLNASSGELFSLISKRRARALGVSCSVQHPYEIQTRSTDDTRGCASIISGRLLYVVRMGAGDSH